MLGDLKMRTSLFLVSLVLCLASFGCAAAPPPPAAVAPYNANFGYKVPDSGKKLGITLAMVKPVFKDTGKLYHEKYRSDDVVKAMLSATDATMGEILIAKGFTTTGPFDSVDEMTFPEKKTADMLFYPEFDFSVDLKFTNSRPVAPKGGDMIALPFVKKDDSKPAAMICDAAIEVVGTVTFVATEPETGQRLYNKHIEVAKASSTVSDEQGVPCSSPGESSMWPQKVKNAWALAHEIVFQSTMKALNDYVNGEEFQGFKDSLKELRGKKTY